MRAEGLREAIVQEHTGGPADPVDDAVDNLPAALVGVEAEQQDVMHRPAGLRDAGGVEEGRIALQRVRGACVVLFGKFREGREVPHGGKAEAGDYGILGLVDELVQRALLKRGAVDELDRGTSLVGVVPPVGGNDGRRIVIAHADRQRRLRLVERRRRIAQAALHRLVVVDDNFLHRGTDDRRAVPVDRDRRLGGEAVLRGGRRTVPSAEQDGVALGHQKAVAGIGGLGRVVAVRPVIDLGEG